MSVNREILEKFKQGKFQACLELINSTKPNDNLTDNLVLENCQLVCESLVCAKENDAEKIYRMQEKHYLYFEKIKSLTGITDSLPFYLSLCSTYNLIHWLLFYTDIELDPCDADRYAELINDGLLTVLGKKNHSEGSSDAFENVLNHLKCLKNLIHDLPHKTVFFILELVTIVLVYLVKLKKNLLRDSLNIVKLFLNEFRRDINSFVSISEFFETKTPELCLFKFSLSGSGDLMSELSSEVVDYLFILEPVFLYLLDDHKGSLQSLQRNTQTTLKSLWCYLVILNSFELENWNLCSGFLNKSSSLTLEKNLKARFHIVEGKLCSVKRNHKEALSHFRRALSIAPHCPVIYYYMGEECGRMGLNDMMVQNFENLVQVLQNDNLENSFVPNLETTILDWIHPPDEITEREALYALAVAYGLSESFGKAAESFDKVLQSEVSESSGKKKILEIPDSVTVFHEAAIMNLLLGNLVRAEQIVFRAIDEYVPREPVKRKSPGFSKDINWLEKIIQQELLELDLEPRELESESFFYEELIFFFPRNVVALLILSEIQRIQEAEECKETLSNVFSMFSKHLASMQKKENKSEAEKTTLTLVKGLAGKTCVRIAAIQMKEGDETNVEKMYKRALSCNKGDKDALCNYYNYLRKLGKAKEAVKLWNTFFSEDSGIPVDSLHSFFLRYFLADKTTQRELEQVQREVESFTVELN